MWFCIGPSLLSGIGQVTMKYCELLGGTYIQFGTQIVPVGQDVFIFALPVERYFNELPHIIQVSKSITCMTVCETEPVHDDYGKLFQILSGNSKCRIVTPSNYCKDVFTAQFTGVNIDVIPHYCPVPKKKGLINIFNLPTDHYIFYHIGNIIDQRKNVKKIIEAFIRLQLPKSLLVLKATCHSEITWKIPGVYIINGLLPNEAIDTLHEYCHCYVSFSSSEGVGMGAVEAAIHDRPVIITDYGAPKEYIHTDYLIPCGRQIIEQDDFLFKKGFIWGKPDFDSLTKYMKDAYDKKLMYMDHSWTRDITNGAKIKNCITLNT